MENNNIEILKNKLIDFVKLTAQPTNREDVFICPFCNSGNGKNKTPAFHLNPKTDYKTFNCFSCNTQGDIFSYYEKLKNVDFKTALNELEKFYNLTSENTTEIVIKKQQLKQEKTRERQPTDFEELLKKINLLKEHTKKTIEREKENTKSPPTAENENDKILIEKIKNKLDKINKKYELKLISNILFLKIEKPKFFKTYDIRIINHIKSLKQDIKEILK